MWRTRTALGGYLHRSGTAVGGQMEIPVKNENASDENI